MSHNRWDDSCEESPFYDFAQGSFGRLVFYYADGGQTHIRSQDYADLRDVHFAPAVGLILDFSSYRITVEGRNLIELVEGINKKLVEEVHEQHRPDHLAKEKEPYIRRITWDVKSA